MTDIELFRLMHRAEGIIRRELHKEKAKRNDDGKPGVNAGILHVLRDHGSMTQKELAEHMHIRPQSLTEALVRLEENGYIVRSRSEKDRRELLVSITESGNQYGKMMHEATADITERLFSCLTEEEKRTLSQLLQKLISSAEKNEEE